MRVVTWWVGRVVFGLVTLVFVLGSPSFAAEPAPAIELAPADRLGAPPPDEAEPEEEAEGCCEEGPNLGRVSFSLTSDITTAYFFRGILQERNGFIWQPALDININLFEGEGALTSLDLGVGWWNSVHSNKTLASGSGPTNWYESDVYPSLSATFVERVATAVTYQVYTSPNGAFATIQNLDLDLGFDDSDMWGVPFTLSPGATLSFELDRTNLGDKEGVFLGFALEPTYVAFEEDAYPLTISAPLALGLSLSDYYEIPGQGDDTFGYFSFGLGFGVPLAFIPEDYGSWSTSVGIDVYVLGDNLKEVNFGDSPFPVGTWSLVMEY